MLLQLAWRNVLRNRRRSAITVASIAIGLAALTFLWAFIDGMNRQMIENSTRYYAGDLQLHMEGYHDDPSLDRTIEQAAPVLRHLREDRDVAAASVRLEGRALASRGDKSRGLLVAGVMPSDERAVTRLFNAVVRGRALADDDTGVLVGESLADALRLQPGDDLLLVGQAYDGSVASARVPVRGVFRTHIDELDGFMAVMSLPAVREFFVAPGAATAVAVRLKDRGTLDAVQRRLQRQMGPGFEVLGWPRLLPLVAVSSRFHEVIAYVILVVFFGIVAAAVANPILMAVLERTHEFGVMLALGAGRSRLLRLVIYEAALLGFVGLVVGNALGLGLAALFGRIGIDLTAFGSALRTMPGLEDVVYPVVRLDRSVMLSLLVFGTAALVSLYPAGKAALLEPVAAIRGLAGRGGGRGRGGRRSMGGGAVFFRIALRSVMRNPRRTAITAGGTAFGIAAFVFLFGFFDGFDQEIIDNATRYVTGHAQVERPGFRRELAPELSIEQADALIDAIRRTSGVAAAAPRVQVQALASSATRSEGVLLVGIDPTAERDVTFIHRTVVEGRALPEGADHEALIGRKLADKLGVRLGEKIVLMTQASDGELATGAYRVGGVFATESGAFDGAFVFVTLGSAQSLTALGRRVSVVNLRAADRQQLDAVTARLQPLAAERGLHIVPWPELLPQVAEMVRLNQVISNIVLAIAFLVTAMAIVNTVYMSVAERTREFGVMMALGTEPAAITRTVLYETAMLMLLGFALGYAAGVAAVLYFGREGIDLSGFFRGYSAIPGLTGIVHPKLDVNRIAVPGALLFMASVLVSLYPAVRAARLDPVQAIRHV
ncbi:MAG TPA: ABC transporter permease [Ideonella sp.]|uniref:ABC transporter permease n=1 Tax=Ideonella sp. TaxID=1929293 RepID=UPI002E37B6EE|nr:ABC transporter permease [Ideonella sp.]HEX5685118.1 ABC transporter permease [Ideonella sp.]